MRIVCIALLSFCTVSGCRKPDSQPSGDPPNPQTTPKGDPIDPATGKPIAPPRFPPAPVPYDGPDIEDPDSGLIGVVKDAILGEVGNKSLERPGRRNNVINTQQELDELWKLWAIPSPKPVVDFKTHFVVVETNETKIRRLLLPLSDDKTELGIATSPVVPEVKTSGFFYAIAAYPRAGLKSVNGNPLPAPK